MPMPVTSPVERTAGCALYEIDSRSGATRGKPVGLLVFARRLRAQIEPFINYNMAHGWYLVSAPLATANWLAAPGQQWVVPVGGGVGRIFKIGDQPVSASIQAYYNAIHPTGAPNWQLRAELSFLFPEK